jgi:hypothetical protein
MDFLDHFEHLQKLHMRWNFLQIYEEPKGKKKIPGSPCQYCSIGGRWWCSRSEYIDLLFHLQMQEGQFGGVTKQWP